MGRIKKGILGGFSGTVGNVVGANWKSIAYMRSLPQKVKNPKTEAQQEQRSKFAIALHWLKPMTVFLRTGWKQYAHRQSEFNAAMSYTLANAIIGNYPNYFIVESKVLVSRGTLTPPIGATASLTSGTLTVTWNNNSGTGTAQATDKTLIAVLNPQKGEAVTIIDGAKRNATSQTVALPATAWMADTVHFYFGFISDNNKEVSNSVYLGNTVVTS